MARIPDNERSAAYQTLRRVRPSGLAAILEDGEARTLKVRDGRGKWEKALATAQAMGAVGLELQDADGAVIEVLPLDGGGAAEDEPSYALAPATDLERTLKLCADFADRATARQQELLNSVCETAIQVMRASADRAERSERALDKVLRAHERVLMERAQSGGEGFDQSDVLALMAAAVTGKLPEGALPGLPKPEHAPGNGKDPEPTVPIPVSVVQRVQRILAKHPELENEP